MVDQHETPDKLIGSIPFGSVRQPRIRAQDTIPFGSLKPETTTTVKPDIGEKLTIPYGSLQPSGRSPVAQTQPPATADCTAFAAIEPEEVNEGYRPDSPLKTSSTAS